MSSYELIYSQDNPEGSSYGWIQWKGTRVCIDLYCICGYHGHFDGEFFYRYQCPKCQRKFAVGQNVKLIEMTPEMIAAEESEPWGSHNYQTCALEEDI